MPTFAYTGTASANHVAAAPAVAFFVASATATANQLAVSDRAATFATAGDQ